MAPTEMAELSDKLLPSLDKPDKELDELWAREAEDRIEAYEQGKFRVTVHRVAKSDALQTT